MISAFLNNAEITSLSLKELHTISSFFDSHALGFEIAYAVLDAQSVISETHSQNFRPLFEVETGTNACTVFPVLTGMEDAVSHIAFGLLPELTLMNIAENGLTHYAPYANYYLRPFTDDTAAQRVLLIVELIYKDKNTEIELLTQLNEAQIRISELVRKVNRDSLTSVSNRRGLQERFAMEIDRAVRYDHKLAVLLLDLDNFKAINDEQGHVAGDIVLRTVAQSTRSCIRLSDVIGRYGGDEFVILQPVATKEQAHATAKRIQTAINKLDLGISLSIGIAECPTDGTDQTALISAADEAMYTAKQTKNHIALFEKNHTHPL